jgi:hypothetical protein
MEELWQHRKRHRIKKSGGRNPTGRITQFIRRKRENFTRALGSTNSSGGTITRMVSDTGGKESEASDAGRRENEVEDSVNHVEDIKVESLQAESLQELQGWLSAELERQLSAIRENIAEDLDRRVASALAQGSPRQHQEQMQIRSVDFAEELSSLQPPLLEQEQRAMKLSAQIAVMSQRLQDVVQDLSKATARLDQGLQEELESAGRDVPAQVQLMAEPWDSQAFECPPYMADLAAVDPSRSIRSCSRSIRSSSSASTWRQVAQNFMPRTQPGTNVHDFSCTCSLCKSRCQTAI